MLLLVEKTTRQRRPIQMTSGPHFLRRRQWIWSWDLLHQLRQLPAATAWYRNYARGRWLPLMKGTRSGLSMMALGGEPMLTYRQTVRSARWWTACMASTGFRQHKLNRLEANSTMPTGNGHPKRRNGSSSRQMSPRPTDGSKSSRRNGNTR